MPRAREPVALVWVDIADAADELGISERQARRYVEYGWLVENTARPPGWRLCVTRASLDRLLAQGVPNARRRH